MWATNCPFSEGLGNKCRMVCYGRGVVRRLLITMLTFDCLVKNTFPTKVFFKFIKDLDLFFIYPKTAPNALRQCVYIFEVSEFHCTRWSPGRNCQILELAQNS